MTLDQAMNSGAPAGFLSSVGLGRRVVEVEPDEAFFSQGTPADSVFCLQRGRVKLSVVSEKGKQATIMLLSPGDIFGEEALVSPSGMRVATATAVNTCLALRTKREEMIRLMHEEPEFCEAFLSYLLSRSMRMQADLVDQIFNSSEKRLARTLLLMADMGRESDPRAVIPPVTQETRSEMIGTTRSRVSYFMNRFRDLGVIDYKGRIQVHKPRLRAILLDQLAGT